MADGGLHVKTWRGPDALIHIVDQYDTGYIDPVYDWLPLCGENLEKYIANKDLIEVKPTCLRCICAR